MIHTQVMNSIGKLIDLLEKSKMEALVEEINEVGYWEASNARYLLLYFLKNIS